MTEHKKPILHFVQDREPPRGICDHRGSVTNRARDVTCERCIELLDDQRQLIRPEALELAARVAYEEWMTEMAVQSLWEDEREAFIRTARTCITTWCEAEGISVRNASDDDTRSDDDLWYADDMEVGRVLAERELRREREEMLNLLGQWMRGMTTDLALTTRSFLRRHDRLK